MLERGQKLDELVDKTDKLSGTSKAFYKEVCAIALFIFLSLFGSLSCRPEVEPVVSYNDLFIVQRSFFVKFYHLRL